MPCDLDKLGITSFPSSGGIPENTLGNTGRDGERAADADQEEWKLWLQIEDGEGAADSDGDRDGERSGRRGTNEARHAVAVRGGACFLGYHLKQRGEKTKLVTVTWVLVVEVVFTSLLSSPLFLEKFLPAIVVTGPLFIFLESLNPSALKVS